MERRLLYPFLLRQWRNVRGGSGSIACPPRRNAPDSGRRFILATQPTL